MKSQPQDPRKSRWRSVSTPSATTRIWACASATMAETIAPWSRSLGKLGDEAAIDLHLVDREAAQVRKAQVARAEIVDGNRDTERFQPLEACPG